MYIYTCIYIYIYIWMNIGLFSFFFRIAQLLLKALRGLDTNTMNTTSDILEQALLKTYWLMDEPVKKELFVSIF